MVQPGGNILTVAHAQRIGLADAGAHVLSRAAFPGAMASAEPLGIIPSRQQCAVIAVFPSATHIVHHLAAALTRLVVPEPSTA